MKSKLSSAAVSKEIKRVIAMEAAALNAVAGAVDGAYSRAVEVLASCRGKVIVTGVGKSGLIAQKIAATMTSTGTPAIHLDPTEALHGGLGVVGKGDVVLAVGKSGESDELNALLPSLRSAGAKVVAITANPRSTLSRSAALTLLTPVDEEACPNNLAPTCSTTAALAVGDALAVALMKLRGFSRDHFAKFHPGGRLGRRLTLKVADIMRGGEENPVVDQNASVPQMLAALTKGRAGAVNVVDKSGRLVGLIVDYDIRRCLEKGLDMRSLSIKRIMNAKPTTVRPETLAVRAVELMEDRPNPFNVLPVVDAKRRSVGLVQIHDLRARGL